MVEVSTLLVVPKTKKCNAHCKFCITDQLSNLDSFEGIEEQEINLNKLEAVIKFSKSIGVIDANITGGTEPTLTNSKNLYDITSILSKYFGRVNMYTNGASLLNKTGNKTLTDMLSDGGLTNLVISRAHYDDEKNSEVMRLRKYDLRQTVQNLTENGIDTKLSCLVAKDYIGNEGEVINYITRAKSLGIRKIIFRELLYLKNDEDCNEWVKNNAIPVSFVSNLMKVIKINEFKGLWNQTIWNYNGVAVTIWPDNSRKDTINNGDLIYMPDNHLYSSWLTKTSRIM